MNVYAGDFNDHVLPARNDNGANLPPIYPDLTISWLCINRRQVPTGHLGLSVMQTNNPHSIWACPSLANGLPSFNSTYSQWSISYEYYGGVAYWNNPAYAGLSYSPVKLTQAKPSWLLAGDGAACSRNILPVVHGAVREIFPISGRMRHTRMAPMNFIATAQ